MFFSKKFSSTKLRKILQEQYTTYLRHPEEANESFKRDLLKLEALINEGKRQEATLLARKLEAYSKTHYPKSWFKRLFDFSLALGVALIAATVIRQMWFELYEIPTGSMRPTFREKDHLSVSKTPYGINIPLETEHFCFYPCHVQRGSVVIFSGDGLDIPDIDTNFLYIFPYTKRFVKRMIGKPGDILYFYGGSIQGIDKEGQPIESFNHPEWMQKLEYIPFLSFEGKMSSPRKGQVYFKQMNREIARLSLNAFGELQGEFFNGQNWAKDQPSRAKEAHTSPVTFSELWGMGNYATSRISMKEGKPFLELSHHPSLSKLTDRYDLSFSPEKSTLPLDEASLNRIMDNMYSARFVVKNGKATRYAYGGEHFDSNNPSFEDVADGTYELYYGKGYKVVFGGTLIELPPDHPLLKRTTQNIVKLYNLGIDFNTKQVPSRYAYFRDGDLFVLGAPLFKKEDPTLIQFVESELKKSQTSNWLPFVDAKPPNTAEFYRAFGLKVPDRHYLVLGDNHAMSGDSRVFGFVPEANLQGAPSLILWPFGERWGIPNMPPYPFITPSRLIVWALAALGIAIWYIWHRRSLYRPLKF